MEILAWAAIISWVLAIVAGVAGPSELSFQKNPLRFMFALISELSGLALAAAYLLS